MKKILLSILVIFGFSVPSFSEDFIEEEVVVTEETADQMSADALNNYEVSGSLFERITALEQEKVVMQLEKERAQLDLELERLNAEKMKIQMDCSENSIPKEWIYQQQTKKKFKKNLNFLIIGQENVSITKHLTNILKNAY